MIDSRQNGAADENLATRVPFSFRLVRSRLQSTFLHPQSREALIERLNSCLHFFVVWHLDPPNVRASCSGDASCSSVNAASLKTAQVRAWHHAFGRRSPDMDWFDPNRELAGGGRARGAGGCYHLSFRSGSRAGGACAGAAHAYITRSDAYDDPGRDPAVYTESDHMPSWAREDPSEYWDAADLYERANGRLYVSADFALPRDLEADDQIGLAHAFAQELTAEQRLPYTLAIHAGLDADGREHNPHAHLMISERQNDGLDRDRQQWFKRANRGHPERGGAPKTRVVHGRTWMEHARERWADLTNRTLERNGRRDRVDHRSYERQGIDHEPGRHFGPAAAHMVARGRVHDGLSEAADAAAIQERLADIERALAGLQAGGGRGGPALDDERLDRRSTTARRTTNGPTIGLRGGRYAECPRHLSRAAGSR